MGRSIAGGRNAKAARPKRWASDSKRLRLFRRAEDAENLGQLRAHRQVDGLTGRQPVQEPLVESSSSRRSAAMRAKLRSISAAKAGSSRRKGRPYGSYDR